MGILNLIVRGSSKFFTSAAIFCSLIVCAIPGQAMATGVPGGDYRGTSPEFVFTEDDDSCDQVRHVVNGSSDWDYAPTDVLRTASGTVNAGGNPVSGALVFSFAIEVTLEGFQISQMSCDETAVDGTFSLDVLKSIAGGGVTISPPHNDSYGNQLGSKSFRVPSGVDPLLLGDVSLVAANNKMLFYSQAVSDYITGPTNVACFGFDEDNIQTTQNGKAAGCAMARGRTIEPLDIVAMRTVTFDGDEPYTVVRFYFDSTPVVTPTSFEVAGITGDLAAFNGRWAANNSQFQEEDPDDNGPLGSLKFLEARLGDDAPTFPLEPFVGTKPQLSATLWAAWTTLPSTMLALDGTTVLDLNDEDISASINIFSHNAQTLSSPEIATRSIYYGQDVFCTDYANSPDSENPVLFEGCTTFKSLTTPYSESTPWGWGEQYFSTTPYGNGGGCGSVDAGNFQGIVVDDQGIPFTDCGNVDAAPFNSTAFGGSPGWDYQASVSGSVDTSGHFGLALTEGIYKLTFRPYSSTTFAETVLIVRVTGGTVETCTSFSLEQGLDDSSRCTTTWTAFTANSGGKYPFQIRPANFYGQVQLPPDGTPVASNADIFVQIRPLVDSGQNYYFGSGIRTQTGEDGKFLIRVEDGIYQLLIDPPEGQNFAQISSYIEVSIDGSVIEQCDTFNDLLGTLGGCNSLPAMTWDTPVGLQYRTPDFTGTVSGSQYFWVEVQKLNTSRCPDCYDYLQSLSTSANASGSFSMNFDGAGMYRLVLNPPQGDTSGATRSEVFIQVDISGQEKTLTVEQNDVVLSPSSGVYNLSFAIANFIVDVREPGSPGAPVPNSWVSVQELTVQGSSANFTRWVDSSRTDANGRALLSLSTPGYFKLVANNATTEPYPELTALIKVTRTGPTSTFYRCTDLESSLSDRNSDSVVDIDDALVCETTPLTISASSPLLMQFAAAEFQGEISGSSYSWVEIQRLNTSQCENCYEWFGGAQTNQSGFFGVNFGAAGTYKLILNPPWNDTSGSTRTEIMVVVGTEPRTFTVSRAGIPILSTEGVFIFSLNSANFKGVVKVGSNPESYSNVSFEKWNADIQQFEWSSTWANGNAQGEFSASLSDGTWKLTARPGFQNEGSVTPAVAYVKISGGDVTSAGVAKTQACAENAVLTPCDRLSISGDRYVVLLGTPNFAGYVTKTDSSSRASSGSPVTATDAVSYSWIEVQEWNQFEQQYRWSPQLSGVNTSSTGRFATTLPTGNATTNPDSKYQVIVNARPQDTSIGLSRGVFKFKVVAGDVVCDADYSFCDPDLSPTSSSRFDLHLSSANLTGTVTAGATPVISGQLRAERWNGQWFEWVNLWAQTSGSGRFAMNLDSDGIYKVTAEAPFWNNTYAGYASVSKYVKVAVGVLCLVDDQMDSTCNGDALTTLDVGVALTGANVRGKVMSGSDTVRNSWVNVMRYNSALGWWEWLTGTSVNGSGEFSLSIVPTQDGDTSVSGVQQRFKIEVMPPWGSSTLTRKEVQLWVGSVGQISGDNYYVECSTSTFVGCSGSPKSGNATPTADLLTVAMTSGNVSGKVTTDGTTGMANAWLNVEQWVKPSWAQNYMWMWVDLNANTNQSGNYNLNLEGLGDGYFRLTANPGWNNPDSLTRTAVALKQASGVVCTVDDAADSSCNDTGANPFVQNIQLTGSNVKGALKDGANAVGFTWVSLMREQNGPTNDGDTRNGTWYEWIGGANTSATGGFGLRIDSPGRYQIEINPPFNSTLSRFSVYLYAVSTEEIYVCDTRSQSNTDCEAATEWTGTRDVLFPTANVAIRVCDKDDTGTTCAGVQNAWVNVFSGNQWVAGSNTGSTGIARFSLPDAADYRFEANPNWMSPDGVRVETASTIIVVGGTLNTASVQETAPVISTSSGQIDIRLGSPNVVGTLYYQVDSVQRVMPYGYIGVRDGTNDWLPGAPVDATGGFKLSLADGTYTLTAYSNGNIADRSPISITVTVTGGVATCPGGNCDIDFDAVIPNVVFDMSNMGTYTRSLYVYSGTTLVTTIAKAPVSGVVSVKLSLADGTYTLSLQRLSTVATDGSTAIVDFDGDGLSTTCMSFDLDIASSVIDNQAELDAWKVSFNGNDAITGLECNS